MSEPVYCDKEITVGMRSVGEDDENGYLKITVAGDMFTIECQDGKSKPRWYYEEIEINAAKAVRDFLIYATPDD